MQKLTCIVCGKENTTDDLLYCSIECYNLDVAQPQKPTTKIKSKQPTHYPEPNEFYTCNCRGAGCIQCEPKKYL